MRLSRSVVILERDVTRGCHRKDPHGRALACLTRATEIFLVSRVRSGDGVERVAPQSPTRRPRRRVHHRHAGCHFSEHHAGVGSATPSAEPAVKVSPRTGGTASGSYCRPCSPVNPQQPLPEAATDTAGRDTGLIAAEHQQRAWPPNSGCQTRATRFIKQAVTKQRRDDGGNRRPSQTDPTCVLGRHGSAGRLRSSPATVAEFARRTCAVPTARSMCSIIEAVMI